MTDEVIQTPFPAMSHGKVFKVIVANEMYHPSWWSFLDELETREEWWNIAPGDVVADVGADFGSYALSALAQGAATVYAWSPPFKVQNDPIECRTMLRSAMLNGWGDKLAAFTSGLWSQRGFLAVRDDGRVTELCPTLEEAQRRIVGGSSYCAAFLVSPLDELRLTKLDWIKVDVEGGELAVFQGAAETIRRCRPKILFENHVHIEPDCEHKCRAFLEALGYRHVGTRPHHSVSHSFMVPT